MKKRIAITLGDPGGVGAEVTLKSLPVIAGITRPLLIGDKPVIESACEMLGIELDMGLCDFLGTGAISSTGFARNIPSAEGGHAAVSYIRKAVELARANAVDAIVTAPISKESLKMAGYAWPGHTEMLAELTGTQHFAMMLCGGPIRVILVTTHTAMRNVPSLITADRVLETILLAKKACSMLGLAGPRIAVAGLNPHAGESGIFGNEEQTAIFPAIAAAKAEGVVVAGPFPSDTLFHRVYKGEFDIVVCMYHDQGLIPLKMIAFDSGVNVTVGLPIIRTSPDHGTAFDISWKGAANPSSMAEAIKFAARLQKP
ncbi:MAG: 4-hydroxythreonine-4-phosphate dehydrogenase [Nitrospirae bacterium]|nr:MAG: 4-hydroxythreonine-4-phosphate dehydrogenase [Nitrospirota bacterium]